MTIEKAKEIEKLVYRINNIEKFLQKSKEEHRLCKQDQILYELKISNLSLSAYGDFSSSISIDRSMFELIIPLLEKELKDLEEKLSSMHILYENKRMGE